MRPLAAALFLIMGLMASGCIHWPRETRSQSISWQFERIPEHNTAQDAFAYFRSDYEKNSSEWERQSVQVIEALSRFRPASNEDVEAYMSFMCFLADDEYSGSTDFLAGISVHQTELPDCTLLEVLQSSDQPYEDHFSLYRVVKWTTTDGSGLRLWLEPRPRH